MEFGRIQRYAYAHARLRARLGSMPGPERWRYIAGGGDMTAVLRRMRENGLDRWVRDLSRNPDMDAIEHALGGGLIALKRDLGNWLPREWSGTVRWLHDGVDLVFLRRLLQNRVVKLPSQLDPVVFDLAQAPLEQREQLLATTRYARYLGGGSDESIIDRWFTCFGSLRPRAHGRESYVIYRLQKVVSQHTLLISQQRARWNQEQDTSTLNPDAQWRLRSDLEKEIRDLLCGESFHAGAVLAYGVLELVQFERARALLVARYFSWEHARFA
jgi:hypothetical protein